ncbi:RNA helicase, putative [Plasmodium malariae]|uniref:RNA helicase, putative n=1 Tax=Plasmodium malariae TaxID=5858 RepID=A0A1D3JKF1_PLAMA|nr:RNA helicase, putative [Plasmodium malariae]SBT86882.1 RNA helicase, putative [Plasmodium malariae]
MFRYRFFGSRAKINVKRGRRTPVSEEIEIGNNKNGLTSDGKLVGYNNTNEGDHNKDEWEEENLSGANLNKRNLKISMNTTNRSGTTMSSTKISTNVSEELRKCSFLDFNFKTDIYLKLNELKIFNPTQIQQNVIPVLLHGKEKPRIESNEIRMCEGTNLYNAILRSRMQINTYLKMNLNMKSNFYDMDKYKQIDSYYKNEKKSNKSTEKTNESNNEMKCISNEQKCFNDVYVIISPDNTGKTLSYFLPILDNFYTNNQKIMQNLSNFYHFLNKYNYKKFQNKLFRKKEKLKCLKNKDNLFFNISYEKYKIRNRYLYIRKYNNYTTNSSYIKNKKNNKLNCLKHKKNVFFPYAIILTNTREAACELFSFLKNFDINIELLTGGYLNKKKSIKKYHVESFSGYKNENVNYNSDETYNYRNATAEFLNRNDFFKNKKKNKNKDSNIINYNVDILIGTPDKIFEKVDNCKNKHLYNFKFLKYLIVEESETLCNVFNEKKLQLIFNHVKNYTNMYYFRSTITNDDTLNESSQLSSEKKATDLENECEKSRRKGGITSGIKEQTYYSGVWKGSKKNFTDDEAEEMQKEKSGGMDQRTGRTTNNYEGCGQDVDGSMYKKEGRIDGGADKYYGRISKEEVAYGYDYKGEEPENSNYDEKISVSKVNEEAASLSKKNDEAANLSKKNDEAANLSKKNDEAANLSKKNDEAADLPKKNSEHARISKKNTRSNNIEAVRITNKAISDEKIIIKKSDSVENIKNTLNSNIPISIFVSATKTFCISEFLSNNIRSKYTQQIINMNSHNISSEMKHIFINSKNKEKISLLLELLNNKDVKKVGGDFKCSQFFNRYVIFCNTRKSVMNVAEILSELKYKVSCIHNEMNYKDRSKNYRDFKKNKTNILICTNILSRGVLFDNCQIINYDISNNINDYIYKSNKVAFKKGNIINNSLTSFFNKKNTGLVNEIIEKTADKKQIIFQNLNKKVSRMLNLQNKYYDIVKKKKKYQKRGGRKALHISPRRNCMSKKNKILSKKLYFYHKMNIERKRLIKKGILKAHEKIPRYPNRKAEVYDSNEYNSVRKMDDGALQILAKKRKTKKDKEVEEANYESDTIILNDMPTYEDEAKIKEKKHQKKTYF